MSLNWTACEVAERAPSRTNGPTRAARSWTSRPACSLRCTRRRARIVCLAISRPVPSARSTTSNPGLRCVVQPPGLTANYSHVTWCFGSAS